MVLVKESCYFILHAIICIIGCMHACEGAWQQTVMDNLVYTQAMRSPYIASQPPPTDTLTHTHTIVAPPADTLKQIIRMSEAREGGLVLLINPQWSRNESANLISDFSIFPWQRRAAEEFLATFTDVRSACRCE